MKNRGANFLLFLFFACFSCWIPAFAATAQTVELDRAAFAKEIARLGGVVEKFGEDPAAAGRLRNSLPENWVIPAQQGSEREEISTEVLTRLLDEFQKIPGHRKELRERLRANIQEMGRLAAAMDAGSPLESGDRSRRAKLDEILKRREFLAIARPGLWEIWRDKILNWIGDFLEKLFGHRWYTRRAGEAAIWVLIGLVFLILAIWLGRHLARGRLQMLAIEPPAPAGKSWRDWAREGRAAAGEGRHREALHAAYWAAIFRLEELGAWSHDRTRTPREYLRMLKARPAFAPESGKLFSATPAQKIALGELTERFEITWYGYREAGESDFRHAVAQLEALGCRLS